MNSATWQVERGNVYRRRALVLLAVLRRERRRLFWFGVSAARARYLSRHPMACRLLDALDAGEWTEPQLEHLVRFVESAQRRYREATPRVGT